MRKHSKDNDKKIALEHIKGLFDEAELISKNNISFANQYVKKAKDIQMKFRIRMPKEYKRKFCKHCNNYFIHGVNCRVRLSKKNVVYTCFTCKKQTRYSFLARKEKKP